MPLPRVERRELNWVALKALAGFWLAFVGLYTLRALLIVPEGALGRMAGRVAIALAGAALSWAMHRAITALYERWRFLTGKFPCANVVAHGNCADGGSARDLRGIGLAASPQAPPATLVRRCRPP